MKEQIKKSIKWIFISRPCQVTLSIVFQIAIMRVLSPRIYGIYALAVASLGIATIVISFGFPHSVIQFQRVKGIEKNVLALTLIQTVVFVAIALAGTLLVGRIYGGTVMRVYLILIAAHAITLISPVFQFTIERTIDFKKIELILLIGKTANVVTTLSLALARFGIYSLIAGYYIQVLLECSLFLYFSRWHYGLGWDRKTIRLITVYSLKRFMARGGGVLMGYVDKLILGLIAPLEIVGGYDRAFFIVSSIVGASRQINGRFAYSLINRIKHQAGKLDRLISLGMWINLILASGVALLSLFCLGDVIMILLGDKWSVSAGVIPYFSLYLFGIIPIVFIRQIFYAVEDPLRIFWSRLIEIAVFSGISWLFFRAARLDAKTVAFILGISSICGGIYLVGILIRRNRLSKASLFQPLIPGICGGAAGYLSILIFGREPLVIFFTLLIVYGGLSLILGKKEILFLKNYLRG